MTGDRLTLTFRKYRYPRVKNLPCPSCGKKVRRQRTFTGTSNPFTQPQWMTYAEMRDRLQPDMDAWAAEAVVCAICTKKAMGDDA